MRHFERQKRKRENDCEKALKYYLLVVVMIVMHLNTLSFLWLLISFLMNFYLFIIFIWNGISHRYRSHPIFTIVRKFHDIKNLKQ